MENRSYQDCTHDALIRSRSASFPHVMPGHFWRRPQLLRRPSSSSLHSTELSYNVIDYSSVLTSQVLHLTVKISHPAPCCWNWLYELNIAVLSSLNIPSGSVKVFNKTPTLWWESDQLVNGPVLRRDERLVSALDCSHLTWSCHFSPGLATLQSETTRSVSQSSPGSPACRVSSGIFPQSLICPEPHQILVPPVTARLQIEREMMVTVLLFSNYSHNIHFMIPKFLASSQSHSVKWVGWSTLL